MKTLRLTDQQMFDISWALKKEIDWNDAAAATSFACTLHQKPHQPIAELLQDAAGYLDDMRRCVELRQRLRRPSRASARIEITA